ncbi:MAG TPA: YceI family protein [Tepidisphaeraceae bacterium]|nr:YceI family protein [Tepidisphaeraceae bacterium]
MTVRTRILSAVVALGLTGGIARAADTFQVDAEHSIVLYRVKHLNVGWAYGTINDPTGTVTWDEQNPQNSSIQMTADLAKLDTDNEKRDEHLRGPDFFNAKQFPTMTFKSTKIAKSSAGENLYDVTGDLTVHGVTKPVTVTFEHVGTGKDPWGNIRAGFETTFTVQRSEFDMNYMPEGIGNDVRVTVSFEATRK